MKNMNLIMTIIVLIAGLNYGLVGAFGFDIIGQVFGFSALIMRIVMIIIGLSAVGLIINKFKK